MDIKFIIKTKTNIYLGAPKKEFEKQYLQLEEEDKITQNDVDSFIEEIKTIKMGDKTTVTQTICKNGFIITDASTCVNAKNFDMEIGKQCCIKRIKNKIWEYLGFLLQSANGFKGDK